MSDIFHEIQEEVRQERYARLWKTYGKYVIVLAILLVVATAAWQGWKAYDKQRQESAAAEYFAALDLLEDGQTEVAIDAFLRLGERLHDGYGALARLRAAAAQTAASHRDEAVKIYDALAADSRASRPFRKLAALYAVITLMDTASLDELKLRLQPLLDDDNPWVYSAREIKGLIAVRAGDSETARKIFTDLVNDPRAPDGLRNRVGQILVALGPGAGQAPTPAPKE